LGTRRDLTSSETTMEDTHVWVMNADGSNQVQLTNVAENFGPSWSPDSTKIAFTSTRDGDWEVFTMKADGTDPINITGPNQTLSYDDISGGWSPDGATIVFTGVRDGAWEILAMNPDGTNERNLTADDSPPYANINWYPTFRPDGSKVLYMSQPNDGSNDWDIWVMNPDGSDKENVLPDDEWQDDYPNWSPDGTQIIFSGNRSMFGTDLFVMDYVDAQAASATQAPVTQLTSNGTSTSPDWVRTSGAVVPGASVSDLTVTEGNSGTVNATFSVSLSTAATETVTVNFATKDSTAKAGADFTTTSGKLTFAPGQTAKRVTVAVKGDTLYEMPEKFFVNLSAPVNATLVDQQAVGTILDNDPKPSLSIGDVSVVEGNAGTKLAVFSVTLSRVSGAPTTVKYATANGTATAQSADFVPAAKVLSIPAGQLSKTFTVTVNGDTFVEVNEKFFVNLTAPVNAVLADAQAVGAIRNDDS
ncbi:MAG: hypothetical protein QOH79_2280, partial [Acidimicrobiaceae bacterium]